MTTPPVTVTGPVLARSLAGRDRRRDRQWALLLALLVASDILAIWASLSLAYSLRIGSGILSYTAPFAAADYRRFAMFAVPIYLLVFLLARLYDRDVLLGGVEEYKRIAYACGVGVVAIIVASFFWRQAVPVSRGYILLALGLSVLLVTSARFAVRRVGYTLRRRGWLTERVLIVGASDQGRAIASQWQANRTSGMQVVGFVDDFKPVGAPVADGLHVLGRPSALHEIARQTGAHEVIVVSGAVAWETFEELIGRTTRRNGYTVRLSPGFYELLATGLAVTSKSFVPLLTVDASRLVGADALLKGVLDLFLSLLALLVCSPILLGATAARLARGVRPPWRGERALGRHGQAFTRHRLAPLPDRPPAADPLSRLPELLDVLTGKLSLVGPRPRLVDEAPVDPLVAGMLQSVKPGVLGPWLVSEPVSAEQELRDELHYIRNWTIWLDVQIFVQTPLRALRAARRRLFAPQALGDP